MPELPEVESMRKILLTLKSPEETSQRIQIQRVKDNPPKTFLSDEEIESLNDNCTVVDVIRKGKLLCMQLACLEPIDVTTTKDDGEETTTNTKKVYLYLHMGMTGRIASPSFIPSLQELKETTEFPPPFTYLTFKLTDNGKTMAEASFSDPRKFGAVELDINLDRLDELAPDALLEMKGASALEDVVEKLTEQSKPIKAILLDQKRAISGVGNWIADELCYQSAMHPEQKFLTREEAQNLVDTLSNILETAVACNGDEDKFPNEWMFHYRWEKKREEAKDSKGRKITFIKSGGRTSAIVASMQKEQGRSKNGAANKKQKPKPEAKTADKKKKVATKKTKKKRPATPKTEETDDKKSTATKKTKKKSMAPSKRAKAEANGEDEASQEQPKQEEKPSENEEKKDEAIADERPRRYPRRSNRARC